MRVLVTGGAGYIGDCVVENLLDKGFEVTVVDKLLYTDTYLRPNVEFYNYDILGPDFIHFLARRRFDSIVHLAAIVGDGACQANPELTAETNEEIVRHITEYIRYFSPTTRLIFASTCSVYGDNSEILNESSDTRPLSLYAGTKLNAEKCIEQLDNYVIFRLGTLFGMSTPFARVRADLVANILTFKSCEKKPITVFGGDQWRPLIHVKDVGRIFAESVEDEYIGDYILSAKNYKIIDVAKEIMTIAGPDGDLIITEAKFEDLRNYKVDNSKSLAVGCLARLSLADGVREMKEIFESGRIKNPWITQYHNAKFMKELAYGDN